MSKVIELPNNGGGTVTHMGLTPDSGNLEGKEDEGRGGKVGRKKREGRGEKEAEEERGHRPPNT